MRERLTICVIVGMRTDEHSLRSQVGIGSESDCLLGQLESIIVGVGVHNRVPRLQSSANRQ